MSPRKTLAIFALLGILALTACQQEKPIDANKEAPAPTYHMVPSQKTGG
jgi:hypothetical protein